MKSLLISVIVSVAIMSMMVGCKKRSDDEIINSIQKTRISIPYDKMYNVVCSRYTFDKNDKTYATVVNVIDQYGCSGCKISELARTEILYEPMFENNAIRSVYILSATSAQVEKVMPLLKQYHLRNAIYIDTCNAFLKANPQIPDNELFHTFVINKEGKVLMVGNPFQNEKMEALFKKVIANERKKHKTKKPA